MSSSPGSGTTLKPMPGTYTAVEVSAPSELRVVERRVAEPGPGSGSDSRRGVRGLPFRFRYCGRFVSDRLAARPRS